MSIAIFPLELKSFRGRLTFLKRRVRKKIELNKNVKINQIQINDVLETVSPKAISISPLKVDNHEKFKNQLIPPDVSVLITKTIKKKERFMPTNIFDILGSNLLMWFIILPK